MHKIEVLCLNVKKSQMFLPLLRTASMQRLCNFLIRETFLLINYPCNSRPNPKNFYSEQTTALELQSTLVKGELSLSFPISINRDLSQGLTLKLLTSKATPSANQFFKGDTKLAILPDYECSRLLCLAFPLCQNQA